MLNIFNSYFYNNNIDYIRYLYDRNFILNNSVF